MSILSEPHFHYEAAAIERLEAIVWPAGPVCPHCGGIDRITPVNGGRIGLRRCGDCKKQFTCKVGTVFEDSKVPVHKWFQAAHLLASSKKGISSHQLHRTLKVTYKTAWFMSHRLREAMRTIGFEPMGGAGGIVESDETFIGTVDGEGGKDAARARVRLRSRTTRRETATARGYGAARYAPACSNRSAPRPCRSWRRR